MLLSVGLLCGAYNTTHAMAWLGTIAGDASLVAGIASLAIGKAPAEDKLKGIVNSSNFLSSTQIYTIFDDAGKVRPYIPLLLPIGAALSIGTRIGMFIDSPLGGIFRAGTSAPLNLALIAVVYGLRLYCAPENAGIIGEAADNLWKKTR